MKQRVIDFLMGKQPQTAEVNPTSTYGDDVDNFINALREQPYMQKLYNAPIQERLSDEQIVEKVTNGLNMGIPELAQAQKDVGIRIPQGTEQVAQAQLGEFNKPMVVAGVNNAPREGGLIQGYNQGYNLNYDNPTNTVGTRIGQALGSIGRFADSSLGRGLIAYGLSNAMGDTNPLEQAFTAGVGRQTAVTKDKVYRQGLINMGIDADEVNAIPGIVSDDIFANYARAKQLQDYALYRQDMIDTQRGNAKALNNYRMAQLAEDVKQNELENYYKRQQLAQGWAKIDLDKDNKSKGKPLSDSQVKELNNTQQFVTALDNISDRYNNAKYDKLFGVGGDIKRNLPTSRYDADVSLFKQDVEILRQRYAKLLEGGRLSDSDRTFYQKALFNPNTSRKDFLEAIRRMKETLKQDYSNSLNMYQKQGKDISEFEMPSSFDNSSQAIQVGNYKVRVK